MQLGKSLVGALVGGAVGIAALIGIHMLTGWDKAWLAILVAIITGVGVRWAANTTGHASYARGALTALIAILAFLAWYPIQAQLTVRGALAKPILPNRAAVEANTADADEAAEPADTADADEAAETVAAPAADVPAATNGRRAEHCARCARQAAGPAVLDVGFSVALHRGPDRLRVGSRHRGSNTGSRSNWQPRRRAAAIQRRVVGIRRPSRGIVTRRKTQVRFRASPKIVRRYCPV